MMTIDFAADRPKEPFHPSVDPAVFFETPAITAVFRRLVAALEEGAPPLAVLTGPPGTGKTMLLRRLSAELARAEWKTVIEGLPLGLDDLRDRLAATEPGRRVVVGLDEAQALSSDLLVALDPLLIVRPDLRILLVGEPMLESKLDALRLGGAAIRESVRCRLAPLDADDVRGYLDFRWRTVRGGAHPFAPEAVERIAAASDGIPQMINLVCGLALRLAEVRGIDRVTAEVIDEATGELPRPEPRHRISHGGRSSAAPASRKMRAAMVAAVVIPPLLVGGGLLLRRAAHVPERHDQPPPAARAPQTPAGPMWVAALAPEPIDVRAPIGPEPDRPPLSPAPVAPAPAPPPVTVAPPPAPPVVAAPDTPRPAAQATRAVEPPASPERSRGGKERRESTALKVAAATPTLPPMPRRAVSIPSAAPVAKIAAPVAKTAAPVAKTAAPVAKGDPSKDEALLRRAEYGDLKGVQTLLLGGASPEARDPAGFTPLMLAVIHGHPAIVNALVAGGGRVNVQNRAGLTPLMLAAINNHSGMLRALIDHGADVNARTLAGWTALTYGAWRGHAHIVRVLLARGADPNVTDREGWTIFQYASWRAAEPAANDDAPELSSDAGRPTGTGPGHAEVIALLRQAGAKR
jgi:type II secretory pathway predicted ATPase ExeA